MTEHAVHSATRNPQSQPRVDGEMPHPSDRDTILAAGRAKGRATIAARMNAKRRIVEDILDRMDATGDPMTNSQILAAANRRLDDPERPFGKNYLSSSHPELAKRAEAIRAAIAKDELGAALAHSSQVEYAIASENAQLLHRNRELKQTIQALQRELIKARNATLSEKYTRLDPRTGELLQSHNQALSGELERVRADAEKTTQKYSMSLNTLKTQIASLEGDVAAQRSLVNQLKAERAHLYGLLKQHGIEPTSGSGDASQLADGIVQ